MVCVNFFLSFYMENYYNTCPEKIYFGVVFMQDSGSPKGELFFY